MSDKRKLGAKTLLESNKQQSRSSKIKGLGKITGLKNGVSESQLQRFYLRFLHGTGERDRLRQLLQVREDCRILEDADSKQGREILVLPADLDKKQQKAIKKLLKFIKRNKKSVKAIKLLGAVAIVGAVIAFNIFIKNKLVEWGIEKGIGHLTGASVECNAAYLNWVGQLGFARLAVANPDDLSRNLIELGSTRIDISVWQLLLRKVVINEIRGEHLQWNTVRGVKGVRTEDKKAADPFKFDLRNELTSAGLDPQKLFEQAKGQFISLQAVDRLVLELEKAGEWLQKIEQHKSGIEGIAEGIRSIDFDNLSLETVPVILEQGKQLAPKIDKVVRSIDSDVRDLEQQIIASSSALGRIVTNFESDLAKFESQISSGELFGTKISDFLEQYLRSKLRRITAMSSSAMEMLGRLQQLQGEESEIKTAAVQADRGRKGRDYFFPSVNYPDFVIRRIYFSLGTQVAQPYLRFEVKNIASDADVMGYPIEGQYAGLDGGVGTAAQFLFENRTKARQVANCEPLLLDICSGLQQTFAEFELKDQPFRLEAELFDSLKMGYLHSYKAKLRTRFRLEQLVPGRKAVRGTITAELSEPQLEKNSGLDLLQQTVSSVLENNDVQVTAGFDVNDAGELQNLRLETNIAGILAAEIRRFQERALQAAIAEVEKLLRNLLDNELRPVRDILAELNKYKDTISSQEERAKVLEKFSAELESRVQEELEKIKAETEAKIAEELTKELEKIVPKIVPKGVKIPKIPGSVPKLKLPF